MEGYGGTTDVAHTIHDTGIVYLIVVSDVNMYQYL